MSMAGDVQSCFQTIDNVEPTLHALVSRQDEHAIASARALDQRIASGESVGSLAGTPIVLKDNICTAGVATTCSSRMLQEFVPPYDAHVVERLKEADAIIVAKSNLDEFAMGSSTEHSALHTTKNPWDPTRVAGGSSGGSAAAVASGMVPVALGSDTGGSIRQPAALCGVVGLKPTYGRVSRYGLIAFGSSLDQIGPIARDVRTVATVLSMIAGHDERDSTSADHAVPDYVGELEEPIDGLRVGVPSEYFGAGLDEQVKTRVTDGIDLLRDTGATIVDVHLPHMQYATACYYVVATAEASSNLARYDGVHYGHRSSRTDDIISLYTASRSEGFGSEVKRRIMLGTYVLSSGYHDAYYLKALKVRSLIRRDFERAFETCDVIASPVTPTTAFEIGEKSSDPLAMYLADIYTISANLAGIPAISVPCGFDDRNLPIGLQLSAPWFEESRLLRVSHAFQSRTDFHRRTPTLTGG